MTSIGGDWISQIDEGSGCPYYTNTVTGETSWEYPTELQLGGSSEGNWIETYDESSGAYYYLHDRTGESTWDKPANFIPAAAVSATTSANPDSDPANWTTGEDNGHVYYYNSVTGATQWDIPDALKSLQPATPASPTEPVKSSSLPEPPTTKRASFLPPPTIAAAVKPATSTPDAATTVTAPATETAKKASFLPPPSLAGATKLPPSLPAGSSTVKDRQAALSTNSEDSHTSRISASEEMGARPESVRDMGQKLAGIQLGVPGQLKPAPAAAPPPPPTTAHEDETTSASGVGDKNVSDDAGGSGDDVIVSETAGGAVGGAAGSDAPPPPPKPPQKKMSKMQSFAALRAMESLDENESVDFSAEASMGGTESMAVANDYTGRSAAGTAPSQSSIQRLIAKDDKTTEELVEQVNGMTMEQYGEKFFNFERKGLFKGRTTIDKLLNWKAELIKTSLRQLSPEMVTEAVQQFRNVTGFMGDRSSTKNPMDHAIKILNHMMLAPEELRDELYCQICKQTTNNPDPQSTEKGWQLMMMCLAIFPPSSDLMPHLMAFCAGGLTSDVPNVASYAEICLHRIPKICRLGARREMPTKIELEALRRGGTVVLRIFFLDEKYCNLRADSWTTARETEDTIAKLLNIGNDKPFSLFEVSSADEERVLDPEERVMDLIAFWQRTSLEEMSKVGKSGHVEEFRFLYKVGLFYDVEDSDTSAVEMMYVQATHDIVDSRYPCSEQDAITLAALQMQECFGDFPASGNCTYLRGKLGSYLSPRLIEQTPAVELEEQVYKLYKKLAGYSQMEARLSYLDYVKSWKIYGSTYFFAEPQNNKELPKECVLAINNKGILVVDPNTKEFLAEYDYSSIVTWGHSLNSFVVVTGSTNRQIKMYFKTDQGKEINNMVRCYVENRMA